jgi:hypothetical protein
MPEAEQVINKEQRETLFSKLREDPAFRETMKKDWRGALKQAKIDPEAVVHGTLSRQEVENFARQRAGWEIIIVISAMQRGAERVQLNEAVNFEAR